LPDGDGLETDWIQAYQVNKKLLGHYFRVLPKCYSFPS